MHNKNVASLQAQTLAPFTSDQLEWVLVNTSRNISPMSTHKHSHRSTYFIHPLFEDTYIAPDNYSDIDFLNLLANIDAFHAF